MRWPWQRNPETRETGGFTEAVTTALEAAATGENPSGRVQATAALETAAGLYARAFASATVSPVTGRTVAVSPGFLGLVARDLIRRGESLHEITVSGSAVDIRPAGSWDVRGDPDPASWLYRLDLFGPSGNVTRLRPGASVLHFVYSYDPARPWFGIGPIGWATRTGQLAGNLELRLAQEAGGPVGHLLPIPADGGDDSVSELRKDLRDADGRTLLAETTSSGWGDGPSAAPRQDWTAKRFGADPPDTLPTLRSDVASAVLGACGIPPQLFAATASAPLREAWRQFLHGSVTPVARTVERELTDKLGLGVRLDFTDLAASDVQGRARAFQSLVKAGMPLERAAALAGLE